MDEQRLTDWAEAVEAVVERALREVVSTYPFEPGEHTVGPPASGSDLAALRQRLPWIPDDLLAVVRWVGEVSLPDIANGYFMFSPSYIQDVLYHDDGIPDRIGEPLDEDVNVVIFGADGGGTLYAIAVGDIGTVYRLRECGYEQGVYSGSAGIGVTVVAEGLDERAAGRRGCLRRRRQHHRPLIQPREQSDDDCNRIAIHSIVGISARLDVLFCRRASALIFTTSVTARTDHLSDRAFGRRTDLSR